MIVKEIRLVRVVELVQNVQIDQLRLGSRVRPRGSQGVRGSENRVPGVKGWAYRVQGA